MFSINSAFRWFLLLFKNEFKMESIMKLWDIMFAQHNTTHFEIFFAASLIITNKEQVSSVEQRSTPAFPDSQSLHQASIEHHGYLDLSPKSFLLFCLNSY